MNPEISDQITGELNLTKKWRTVLLLALAELLVMGLWFSASAVTPSLAGLWDLSGGQVAWLTLITVRLVPTLVDSFGWQWSFAILALGPLFGIWAMRRLKQSPEAAKLAGGRG